MNLQDIANLQGIADLEAKWDERLGFKERELRLLCGFLIGRLMSHADDRWEVLKYIDDVGRLLVTLAGKVPR